MGVVLYYIEISKGFFMRKPCLRGLVDSGDSMFSALREEGESLSDELDHYVARSEAKMARLLERLSPPDLGPVAAFEALVSK